MGNSNNEWGFLITHDSEMAEVWDTFSRLPESGQHPVLDSFVKRKNISIEALMRLGARLTREGSLAFAFEGGIKYRDMVTGRRWSYVGSEWKAMKILKSATPADTVIICEGETDGARLSMLYPESDVAVMPGGARYFPPSFASQVIAYDRVLIGLDADDAGDQGAAKIQELVLHAVRFSPPDNPDHDWCGTGGEPPALPAPTRPTSILVSAGDLMQLEVPEITSWFEGAVLPVGGLAMLHGWAKSFKSFNAFDMLSSLSQGLPWCHFEPTEEPCRTAVMQFEIPWPYYRERVAALIEAAAEPGLFCENFFTYSPMVRPHLIAGNKPQEDALLRDLCAAGIQVLLVDPVRRAFGTGSMNDEEGVRPMLALFERINDEGITVVATHHDNKEGGRAGGGSPLAMTGSGAWAGDADTIVSIELPKGEKLSTSVCRNLIFTLRNAPSPSPRGMQMQDNGVPTYTLEPFGLGGDFAEAESDGEVPAI